MNIDSEVRKKKMKLENLYNKKKCALSIFAVLLKNYLYFASKGG